MSSSSHRNQQPNSLSCIMIRIFFAIYLFGFLYLSQSAALTLTQHRLAEGQTAYHPLIGALVLTVLLLMLQRFVSNRLTLSPSRYVLTCFPSALVAVMLTAFTPHPNIAVIGTSVVLLSVWIIIAIRDATRTAKASDKQGITPHVLYFLVLALYMGLCGNTNDVLTYEIKTARAVNSKQYTEALTIGNRSLVTSPTLTALRAYALSHESEGLPDRLFKLPLPQEGSEMLLLRPADSLATIFVPDTLYAYLGSPRPLSSQSASDYFEQSARRHPASAARDYWLCALLLDRRLDRFAEELPRYYAVTDSVVLPRYYAQALILYERLSPNLGIHYADPNVAANYLDFKEKVSLYPDVRVRRNELWREYGDTYWWYYYFHNTEDGD